MFAGKEDFKVAYEAKALETFAKPVSECTTFEQYELLVYLICSTTGKVRTQTSQRHIRLQQKKVHYFSMEFLIGRLLRNYLINLEMEDLVREGLSDLNIDLDELCQCEQDPGLGNGGLGRLAACFLDSMAYLGVPGVGMGIRYRFGLFRQKIENGYQVEEPDSWMEYGYPWETKKPDEAIPVSFGGYVQQIEVAPGSYRYETRGAQTILAVPYDVPIVGYGGKTVNVLRLWSAEPVVQKLDLAAFNHGDYSGAMRDRNEIEAITTILYPDDSTDAGKSLRLKQEYFFVSAGTKDIVKNFKKTYGPNWDIFPDKISIHTNDTHPALCVPELMRILIDEENLSWDEAWAITTKTISYTNHTIMPEALEKWSIDLMRSLLPRVYQIIEEIDRRYCESFDRTQPDWQERLRNTAILWDGQVHMANLSIIGAYSVNGVAALHTEILKTSVLKDFYAMTPEKFNNKTNGVTHRRFLAEANPALSRLITEAIGPGWMGNALELQQLLPYREDPAFLSSLRNTKRQAKVRLGNYVYDKMGITLDPDSIFDIQVKRIHAYKRQLLAAFKVMHLYNVLKANPDADVKPHTFLFAGKAAAGYAFAKEVIKYICSLAELVNNDPVVSKKIKVIFLENFNVSSAQLIYPAADISEQISTAGKEASGTGNMKFMFNGAITLGTLDGANVEIRDVVGDENIIIFGMKTEEVNALKASGYRPENYYNNNQLIRTCINKMYKGINGCVFNDVADSLKNSDPYMVLADFDSYRSAQQLSSRLYQDTRKWTQMSLANIANAGIFSADRAVNEYAKDIWGL
ncbi:glycogen/starch/alpha-glucan phosphorylase [Ruminococcus sp.]|uniref:glycogen/starch/alpha-glucan phosphorylase n=1 Tax=Ruminococcus sp. TaxID=41978 RepID=UPI0025EA7D5B|nr:glycogen/starch/alpha-glucan phosphorylase [Ruminococcus sp.]MCI5816339.1 glycogen/starch/alpha-glucan phosphorylase [Ruminococcus sp.]